jgi:hypothetical protein
MSFVMIFQTAWSVITFFLPFVDRLTWDNLIVGCHEIHQGLRSLKAPWSVGAKLIRRFGYEEDEGNKKEDESTCEQIDQLSFSSDGKHLCAFLDQSTESGTTWWGDVVDCI